MNYDMNQFRECYIPGGMGLNHSGWWLCVRVQWRDGTYYDKPVKFLRRADYK